MFTVFIDDSGTDPNQQIAIAVALVVPAKRIVALDTEFVRLKQQERFTDFHMSLCAARNQHSEFADWTDEKQLRVISRVRQIGKKFGLQAMSLAVTKDDYDRLVPPWLRELAGKFHYTWAIRHMLDLLDQWALQHNVTIPFEYIYDYMHPKAQREPRKEIETVMAQAEENNPGRYTNYGFRRRQDLPALQCTDALAWTCYQFALHAYCDIPLTGIAQDSWDDYYLHHPRSEWLYAVGMKPEHLKEWVATESKEPQTIQRYEILKAKQAGANRQK